MPFEGRKGAARSTREVGFDGETADVRYRPPAEEVAEEEEQSKRRRAWEATAHRRSRLLTSAGDRGSCC